MIVCSCNRLTERDVETAVRDGATRPREIYASKGCKAQCGNCTPGIVCMLRQAMMQHARAFDMPQGFAVAS